MIPEKIYGDLSPEERERLLQANGAGMERTTFSQPLSDDELQAFSAENIRGQIDLKRMKEDAKAAGDEWKAKIKKKEAGLADTLEMISTGSRKIAGVLFKIPMQAEGKMAFYDKHGNLIETRPLKDEEKQARAFIEAPGGGTVANPDVPEDIDHEEIHEPNIAGHAPAPGAGNGDSEGDEVAANIVIGMEAMAFDAGEDVPDAEYEEGSKGAGFDYEARKMETEGIRLPAEAHGGMENGKAWDDPSQTRVPDSEADQAAEAGAKKKRTPRAPKVKPDAAQE